MYNLTGSNEPYLPQRNFSDHTKAEKIVVTSNESGKNMAT
jgi:hypothetical protein